MSEAITSTRQAREQRDRLVSTALLRQRIQELEEEVESQRRVRADDDPFFRVTAWMIAEMQGAIRQAEREYVSTADASRLTGWSEQTLRKYGAAVINGDPLPVEWQDLLARFDAGEWAFCVASIPVKPSRVA